MSERMKPPTRRTGRTLGGAKKTAPPPPPPAAELTPQQYAAEQAAAQSENRPAASQPQVQPAPSPVPAEASAHGRAEAAPEVARSSAQPTVEVAPSAPVPEPAAGQPVRPAVVAEAKTEPLERQAAPVAPAPEPADHAVQPTQSVEPVSQNAPVQGSEMAVRQAVMPAATSTAFPVNSGALGPQYEHHAGSHAAPTNGTSWEQGPGRPKDIPETAVVLNQRIIARESLDASVPSALRLKRRIKRFALDNELDHLPMGDIVSVALDEWLTARGF